jgi:hypothetical protein
MKSRVLVTGTDHHFTQKHSLDTSCPDFKKAFLNKDYELVSDTPGEFLVTFNHNSKVYRDFISSGGEKSRAVLIRLEPECVYPLQYNSKITSKYGLVLSVGRPTSLKEEVFFRWPYEYNKNPSKPDEVKSDLQKIVKDNQELFTWDNWKNRRVKISLIAANKVSATANSNYTLRKKLAHQISINGFEIYGPLWEKDFYRRVWHSIVVGLVAARQGTVPDPYSLFRHLFWKYTASRGIVEDKHQILRGSKYSLIVENSNHCVTEKLFDAVLNGAIPIYVGPRLELVGLPSGIAIQISGEIVEVERALELESEDKIQERLDEMYKFICSPDFLNFWSSKSVYTHLANSSISYFEVSK